MFDHFQFTMIGRLNILGPYAVMFFTALDFSYTTSHIHNWVLFSFGSTSSFFLELFFDLSPVARWAPSNLGSSSFSVISFCLFILFMGFSRQEYWSGLPLPSPVHYVFSELSTMTCLSWVALYGMAHSFIELDKAMIQVISFHNILQLWFTFCVPSDG